MTKTLLRTTPVGPATAVTLGVLGDSDSHAYQDTVFFPSGGSERGGRHRAGSLQWTEWLARLRPAQIDPGRWGQWGSRGRVAQLRRWCGLAARAPAKRDFEYNLAWSGARCEDLFDTRACQVPPLLGLIGRDPERWRHGLIVIRIGINDLGSAEAMARFARDGATPVHRAAALACTRPIEAAVEILLEHLAQVRIVLVGILNNADWARFHDRWHGAEAQRNIAAVLDVYDDGLRAIAGRHPGVRFFDDRAFFRRHWGARSPAGRPAYRSVALGPFTITNTLGDAPTNGFLADGHSGTVWNALWAQALVDFLREQFDLPLQAISDDELIVQLRRLPGPA